MSGQVVGVSNRPWPDPDPAGRTAPAQPWPQPPTDNPTNVTAKPAKKTTSRKANTRR